MAGDIHERTVPGYPAMAGFYEALKSGDNYDAWADALLGPIRQFGTGGTRLLDVGCGTGISSVAFQRRGFDVTGCDLANEMLDIARAKTGSPVEYVVADMRRLPAALGVFDVVTWVDDVANHMLTPEDLVAAMRSSRARLRPGGVLVFDTNSIGTFTTLFGGAIVVEHPDSFFTLLGRRGGSATDGPARLRIVGFLRTGTGWERHEAVVEERYYSGAQIEDLLREAGLTLVATLGWADRRLVSPANEREHVKIVYVAQPV
jgi:SAM-dependent methyltransferase